MDIKNNLAWANIIKIVPIDEEVLSNILPLVDLNSICQYQILAEKFIVDNLDKVDWDSISSFEALGKIVLIGLWQLSSRIFLWRL